MEKKTGNRKLIGAVILLALLIAIFAFVYAKNRPAAQEGTKAYSLTVVDDQGSEKSYSGKTDAEYLSGLMDELSAGGDFSYQGSTSDYGLFIESVNGLAASYDDNGSYWAIYVNGEYGSYGADAQPVTDGDSFALKYEVYDASAETDAAQ
ncbi:MAG: DUF4430 domain-containing protein [bacterium]